MSLPKSQNNAPWKKPALCLAAVVIILAMMRLGFWQLDRAQQKQEIASQLYSRTEIPAKPLAEMLKEFKVDELRFRNVFLSGQFKPEQTLFLDNQVHQGQVGYQVYTPFMVNPGGEIILVARGWIAVGESRAVLPVVPTDSQEVSVSGRFNLPPPEPPLWDPEFSASSGQRWQFLPIPDVSQQLGLDLFPLVVELAPEQNDSANLVRKWREIDDQWVAKHQGYAFQWFAMAVAFFIACLVLLLRRSIRKDD